MARQNTKDGILRTASALLADRGLGGVTFDAIAARLGVSKQAVLYWFPTKRALLAALYVPWLEAEALAAEGALAGIAGRNAAIAAYVRAVAGFHLADLDRFRLVYLSPQLAPPRRAAAADGAVTADVVPVTDRLYAALARHLGAGDAGRREAVAIHSAVLGLVLMVALSDAIADPLKHRSGALVDALVDSLTRA